MGCGTGVWNDWKDCFLGSRDPSDFCLAYLRIVYTAVLEYFCMCNLSAETKFHIQKYDGLEIEKPSRALEHALEVTLCSSTDTNLGHNHTKITLNFKKKKTYGGNLDVRYLVFSNHIFSESSWPLMI
jgi:hypothetical protein